MSLKPGTGYCSNWGQPVSIRLRHRGLLKSLSPKRIRPSGSLCAKTNCERPDAGRGGISSEQTSLAEIQPTCGSSILNWFTSCALHVTLHNRLCNLAPGLTPRSAIEKFSTVQMIDVHLPTTDGRTVIMSRHTPPEPELQILLNRLRLCFPGQPPPRMVENADLAERGVVKTF